MLGNAKKGAMIFSIVINVAIYTSVLGQVDYNFAESAMFRISWYPGPGIIAASAMAKDGAVAGKLQWKVWWMWQCWWRIRQHGWWHGLHQTPNICVRH